MVLREGSHEDIWREAMEQRVSEYAQGAPFPDLAREWRGTIDQGELSRNAAEGERTQSDVYETAALRYLAEEYPRLLDTTASGALQPKYDIRRAAPAGASVLLGLGNGSRVALRPYVAHEDPGRRKSLREILKDRSDEYAQLLRMPYAADPVSGQRTIGEQYPHAALHLTREEIEQLASAALYHEEAPAELVERMTEQIGQSLSFHEHMLQQPQEKQRAAEAAAVVDERLQALAGRTRTRN